MSENGAGTPAIGSIRIVGDDLFTFDGADWRPMVGLPDSGVVSDIRDPNAQRRAADAAGQPDRPEQRDATDSGPEDRP